MSEALRHAGYVLGENPLTAAAFALFTFLVLCAVLGPGLVPYDPLASDTARALSPPSAAHWFGTDQLGRDIFSRIVVATRLDLGIAVTAVALAFAIGTLSGLTAGYFGGWTDRIIGRIVDTIMAFPLFVLAMGIVAALGTPWPTSSTLLRLSTCRSMPGSRAPRPMSGARRDLSKRHGFVAIARRVLSSPSSCPTSCR